MEKIEKIVKIEKKIKKKPQEKLKKKKLGIIKKKNWE